MTALPIVHVIRPRPPWRSSDYELTECGLSPAEHQSITRDEFVKRYKELGRERSAMLTCVTCMTTFERFGGVGARFPAATWEDDPVRALARETEKVRWAGRQSAKRERLEIELRAIIQLIEAHRDEFDVIIARMGWRAKQPTRARGARKRAAR